MVGLEGKFKEFDKVMFSPDGEEEPSAYVVYEVSFKGAVVIWNGVDSYSLPFDKYSVDADGNISLLEEANNG